MKIISAIITATTLIVLTPVVMADNSNITYDYRSLPYSDVGTITIYNHSNSSVSIATLKFSINAAIVGTPWGNLWGWQSKINANKNINNVDTDYTVSENPTIQIPAGQSAVINYSIDSTKLGGPFNPYNVAMNPSNLSLTATNGTEINPSLENACVGDACQDPGNGHRIIGYYIDWAYWRNPKFTAEKIAYQKINSIFYAFSIFDNDGRISLYDKDSDSYNLPIIATARQRYPYLHASLSFGGWSWASTPTGWHCTTGASPNGPAACFSQLSAPTADGQYTAETQFVEHAVAAMTEVHFDGIDIDWEYPATAQDAKNYVHLLKDLRAALDKQAALDHTHYYLTIAVSAGIDKMNVFSKTEWQEINNSVDYVDVMSYDLHGGWDQYSDFMSAMALDLANDPYAKDKVLSQYTVEDAMQHYLDLGIEAKKLVLGIPLYGRMVSINTVDASKKGLYQPINQGAPLPQGEWDNQQSGFTGVIDYQCIVDASTCGNGFVLPALTLVDPTKDPLGQYAKTPWGYSDHLFVTFDDVASAKLKIDYLLAKHFGGTMLWDLTSDFPPSDPRAITSAIVTELKQQH